jgi:hypothetical protein
MTTILQQNIQNIKEPKQLKQDPLILVFLLKGKKYKTRIAPNIQLIPPTLL